MSDWELEPTDECGRCIRHYSKRSPRALKAVLENLDRVQEALKAGADPLHLPLGKCLHGEQRGVPAVDQGRGGKALAQTRLDFYLDRDDRTIHLIAIGDERSQPSDVKDSSAFVERLASQKGKASHGQD